jgi:isovaleryl-CoA dehydrogenase
MYTKISASRSYVYAVARACDLGQVNRRVRHDIKKFPSIASLTSSVKDCAGAILYSTEKAVEVALEAMQCLGGNGYINGTSSFAAEPTSQNALTGGQTIRWAGF